MAEEEAVIPGLSSTEALVCPHFTRVMGEVTEPPLLRMRSTTCGMEAQGIMGVMTWVT